MRQLQPAEFFRDYKDPQSRSGQVRIYDPSALDRLDKIWRERRSPTIQWHPDIFRFADPAYPTSFVDTDTMPTVTGSTFTVNAGGNIQTAINSAAAANGNLTHEVVLQAGATFNLSSQLNLPAKSGVNPNGTGWIIIRTSNLAGIAAQKQRIIQASHAVAMPKIQVTANPYGVYTNWDAHHYRFIGIEFINVSGPGSLFIIWADPNLGAIAAHFPHHIILDRCILRQTVSTNKILAIMPNNNAVVDSVLINQTQAAGDSNAIWFMEGPGPAKVWNNYLECAGEIVFHGSTDYGTGLRPTDIEIRRNLLRAPLYASGKNMMEWKGGLRIWIAGNIFDADVGTGQPNSIQVTPRAEESSTNIVDDWIFEYNFLRSTKGIGLSAYNPGFGSPGSRFAVRHNYISSLQGTGGCEWSINEGNGITDAAIEHNTFISGNTRGVSFSGSALEVNWLMRNNILFVDSPDYAIARLENGTWVGTQALNLATSNRTFTKNVFANANSGQFTGTDLSNNFFPGSVTFNADGSLPAGSPYKNAATDGTDIGANLAYPSEIPDAAGRYSVYSTIKGIGRFGSGANDFYAYNGQWPLGGVSAPTAPTNLRVV